MSWAVLALQATLSAVFVLAATGKLLRPDEFEAALRLSHLPEVVVRPLAVAVPLLELMLALALLLAPASSLPLAFAATAALFASFAFWMLWVRGRRLRVRCGCFGAGGGEVGALTIARTTLLLALAFAGLLLSDRVASAAPGPSLPMAVTVTSLGMVLVLFTALRSTWPHLVLTFAEAQKLSNGSMEEE